jgi:hypothetical protein
MPDEWRTLLAGKPSSRRLEWARGSSQALSEIRGKIEAEQHSWLSAIPERHSRPRVRAALGRLLRTAPFHHRRCISETGVVASQLLSRNLIRRLVEQFFPSCSLPSQNPSIPPLSHTHLPPAMHERGLSVRRTHYQSPPPFQAGRLVMPAAGRSSHPE